MSKTKLVRRSVLRFFVWQLRFYTGWVGKLGSYVIERIPFSISFPFSFPFPFPLSQNWPPSRRWWRRIRRGWRNWPFCTRNTRTSSWRIASNGRGSAAGKRRSAGRTRPRWESNPGGAASSSEREWSSWNHPKRRRERRVGNDVFNGGEYNDDEYKYRPWLDRGDNKRFTPLAYTHQAWHLDSEWTKSVIFREFGEVLKGVNKSIPMFVFSVTSQLVCCFEAHMDRWMSLFCNFWCLTKASDKSYGIGNQFL